MIEDDTHDKLTKAYLEYFKANEAFVSRKSHRTHLSSRRWLREIRALAKIRMEEIHETYQTKKEAEKKGKQ
jgi:hypothetical protein